MTQRSEDDIVILKLKLEECNKLVSDFEQKVKAVQLEFNLDSSGHTVSDAPSLLVCLKEAIKPLATTGFATSLIESDVQRTRKRIGSTYQQQFEACWRDMETQMFRIAGMTEAAPASDHFLRAVNELAASLLTCLKVAVLPYQMLRSELIGRLNTRSSAKVPTEGQANRALRNQRIREIASQLGTRSPAEVLRVAENDPTIKALPVKLTREIVANVLLPRRKPRRSRGQGR